MNARGTDGPQLQLTRAGVRPLTADLTPLRDAFRRAHCVRLPALIAPDLLSRIQREVERGEFRAFDHDGIATELRLQSGVATGLLHVLVNDPQVYRFVEQITATAPVRSFLGRVYRRDANGHYDSWHSDLVQGRSLGMSVNLSRQRYEGGVFELRETETGRVLASIANVGFGDAILFRLAPTLEHQVTPVRGVHPKTAFAGWFLPDDSYRAGRRATGGSAPL
ncbi:MAG: 2OG-Fe(II) oxygenase [Acidobacteria bacterium]|nr:2OG-Fe(II) oxygenase [Acidobacteriota bacterium]